MSQEFTPLFDKAISKHIGLEMEATPSVYGRIFKKESVTSPYYQEQLWEMYGRPGKVLPFEPTPMGQFRPSFSKRYIVYTKALGDLIAEEHWEDDPTGIIKRVLPQRGGAIGRAFIDEKELDAAAFFAVSGFTTSTPASGMSDGVSLFNTAHPVSLYNSSVTLSNRPSTDVDLSYSSYSAARVAMVRQKAANNVRIVGKLPSMLVYGPQLDNVARRLARSDWEEGTSNRNMNVFKGEVELIMWPYLEVQGTAGALAGVYNGWFLLNDDHQCKMIDRQDVRTKTDYKTDIRAYLWVTTCRYAFGATDWRGTYGSKGG